MYKTQNSYRSKPDSLIQKISRNEKNLNIPTLQTDTNQRDNVSEKSSQNDPNEINPKETGRKNLNNLFMISTAKLINNNTGQNINKFNATNQSYNKGKSWVLKNDLNQKKSIMMNFGVPPSKFFISEIDTADMYYEVEPKKHEIIGEIDKWEYKNITSKFKKNNLFHEVKPDRNKNDIMSGQQDSKSGLNIDILNGIYNYGFEKQGSKYEDPPTNIMDVYKKDKRLQSSNSKENSCFNDRTKSKLLNQELLNEIYYNKAWEAYKKSMTPEQQDEARKFTLTTLRNADSGDNDTKANQIIDDELLRVYRQNVKMGVMPSYKNLNQYFQNAANPLNEKHVKERMQISLSNITTKQSEFRGYNRNVEDIIKYICTDIYDQDNLLEKLRNKLTKLTSQRLECTRAQKVIDKELLQQEQRKRFNVATASLLVFGNSNVSRTKITSPKINAVLNYNEVVNLGENLQGKIDILKQSDKRIIKPDKLYEDIRPNSQNNLFNKNTKGKSSQNLLTLFNSTKDKTDGVNDEINEKVKDTFLKQKDTNEKLRSYEIQSEEIEKQISKNDKVQKHYVTKFCDLIYKTINNDNEYVQKNGITRLLIKLYGIKGEINKDLIPNTLSKEAQEFVIQYVILKTQKKKMVDENEIRAKLESSLRNRSITKKDDQSAKNLSTENRQETLSPILKKNTREQVKNTVSYNNGKKETVFEIANNLLRDLTRNKKQDTVPHSDRNDQENSKATIGQISKITPNYKMKPAGKLKQDMINIDSQNNMSTKEETTLESSRPKNTAPTHRNNHSLCLTSYHNKKMSRNTNLGSMSSSNFVKIYDEDNKFGDIKEANKDPVNQSNENFKKIGVNQVKDNIYLETSNINQQAKNLLVDELRRLSNKYLTLGREQFGMKKIEKVLEVYFGETKAKKHFHKFINYTNSYVETKKKLEMKQILSNYNIENLKNEQEKLQNDSKQNIFQNHKKNEFKIGSFSARTTGMENLIKKPMFDQNFIQDFTKF